MIWTLPIRIFHWGFACSIVGAYITGEQHALVWHERFGLAALGFVVFRIIWGFIGPTTGQFHNLIYAPHIIRSYISGVFRAHPPHYDGHNPLGGLSVIAMILVMAVMAISGLFTDDRVLYEAPLAPYVHEIVISFANILHDNMSVAVLPLIVLHLVALTIHRYIFGERLLIRMVRGVTKPNDSTRRTQTIGGLILLALCLLGAWALT